MKLKDLLNNEKERAYLYAVVLDCSGTYYVDGLDKYLCTMKLIDETVNPGSSAKSGPQWVTATMFAENASQLPLARKVGSVIRIHRGQTKKNKGRMQLNCDVSIKGAWVLFDPENVVAAMATSSKKHTFTEEDKLALKKLRTFATTYFRRHELESLGLQEALKKRPKDFDALCYVLSVEKRKGLVHVHLCDAHKVVKLSIPAKRDLVFTPLTVVRLRGVDYDLKGKADHIVFQDYSNALIVPDEYKSAKSLCASIKSKTAAKEVQTQVKLVEQPKAVTVSKLLKKRADFPVVKLDDVISGKSKKKSNFYRLNLSVIEMGPTNPADWVRVIDTKTKKEYWRV